MDQSAQRGVHEPSTVENLGRFELGERIGAGNHGVVFRALDKRLNRPVAIKRFSHFLADDSRAMKRITREVESLARVSNAHVVTIYDLVRLPDGDGEITPHLVMELVEGRSLRDLLSEYGPTTRAALVAGKVLDGLQACHDVGVLHLDIKPANILVTTSGDVKIVDFGIARAASDGTATVAGTPQYMAPEQYEGRADHRSDIYSVGCMLFETLTGRLPFEGNMAAQLLAHRSSERPDPRQIVADLDPEVAEIIMKAMALDPADRFISARSMRSALAAVDLPEAGSPVMVDDQLGSRGTQTVDVDWGTAVFTPVVGPETSPDTVIRPSGMPQDTAGFVASSPLLTPPPAPSALPQQTPQLPPLRLDATPTGEQPWARALASETTVSRWTKLRFSLTGYVVTAFVLAVIPGVVWMTTGISPALDNRPATMSEGSVVMWWLLAIAIATLILLGKRETFSALVTGPQIGSAKPERVLTPSQRSAVAMAAKASLVGAIPLLTPWYIAAVLGLAEAGGLDVAGSLGGDSWYIAWLTMPAASVFLAWRAVTRMRPGRIMRSLLLLVMAAVALFLFVAYPEAIVQSANW